MKRGQREVTPEKRPARQWEKRGAVGESRDQTGSPRVMERKRRTQGCEGRIRAVPCFLGTALPSLI